MRNIDIATDISLWNEYVNPDKGMSDKEFNTLTVAQRLAIMAECGITEFATGWSDDGRAEFCEWYNRIAKDKCTRRVADLYFDTLSFANWETGEDTTIEVGGLLTKSGNPETFLATADMVEFAQ